MCIRDRVSFKYHSGAREYALSGVELHIPAGQTVGILGGTGSVSYTHLPIVAQRRETVKGKAARRPRPPGRG